ncbi:MAG: calcium-binding protein, partial [FCB group bacterium]|nr:calcium-binding protein [FCB group bacterium]
KTQNVWISKNRKANPADGWDYYFNLLDVNTTGSYTITFENIGPVAAPPVLQTIANVISVENQVISFAATATDSNGTIPVLSATPLPVGTTFIDNHDGTGSFTWTPFVGQAGLYGITFKASDGALKDSQYMSIIVCPADDTDCDNLPDSWEMDKFGTLDRDGTGDFDNDGISDLDEYLAGSDPTVEDNAPSAPVILSPVDLDEETILTPDFVIENSTDPDGHTVSYQFEVYSDQALT